MVKFSNPVIVDAHYEAKHRTIGVSMKPTIGKELFVVGQVTGGAFNSQFDTERFIHNDVRQYLLRASTHCQSVQNELSNLNSARFISSNDDASIYSPIPSAVSYRVLAEKVSNDISKDFGLHLPAGIRENVLAKLLHDAGVQITVDYSSTESSSIQFHSDENRTSDRSSQFASLIDLSYAFSTDAQDKSSSSYIRGQNTNSGWNRKAGNEVPKMVLVDSRESLLCSSANGVFLCTVDGFGTAPIWYQQSMATGPPLGCILAETMTAILKDGSQCVQFFLATIGVRQQKHLLQIKD